MAKPKKSVYLKLESGIAADERAGIMHRWNYGRELLKQRAGRLRLPKGLATELVVEALRAGLTLSEQEIQRRMRFAEVYPTEAHSRQALTVMGSWSAIVNAGFPPVELDEPDEIDDMEEVGVEAADVWEPPLFEVPGFKPVLRINGRKVDLADATVAQAVAYRDMCKDMHESFGRTVAQIEETVHLMLLGAAGEMETKALDAYRRGLTNTPKE